MRLGYTIRSTRVMVRHPVQGVERIRGRMDRHDDLRQLGALPVSASDFYEAAEDWDERLHAALDLPWPCEAARSFDQVWDGIVADLTRAGVRVGVQSYGGWNDGDKAFAQAIWCVIAHVRPEKVVETGVAHGLTSRVVLEGLKRNGSGHLWSVDLPAVDSALHSEIGMAISPELRSGWTYVQGTARERLPGLLAELAEIDMFIHDSLHTGRNQRFEIESAWSVMRPGAVAVIDDIDHSLAFRAFVDGGSPRAWLAARHVTGPGLAGAAGLWGLAIKGTAPARPLPQPRRPWIYREYQAASRRRATRAASISDIEANPHYQALRPLLSDATVRGRRHGRIELVVIREMARLIRGLDLAEARLLQVQAHQGQEVLLFRDQLVRPHPPVIYDQEDARDPEVTAATEFAAVDVESATFPAPDGQFDLVVWNRDLVTLKNAVPALREARRVLKPGGFLLLSVPNLAALHNRLLLLAGRQPTTLHINNGDHVRGFASASMSTLLERDLDFRIEHVIGVGIAPVTGAALPGAMTGFGHTVVWVLRKPDASAPDRPEPVRDVAE
jgi:SAM-dependent methyltransferase